MTNPLLYKVFTTSLGYYFYKGCMGYRSPPHSQIIQIDGLQDTPPPTRSKPTVTPGLVTILPYAQDNYSYCFHGDNTDIFFDLGDAKVVEQATQRSTSQEKRKLVIFLTHYHHDHTAGIYDLKNDAVVYGTEKTQHRDHVVSDGDKITVDRFEIVPVFTPCHTLDHMCYRVRDTVTNAKYIITGDCIFMAGTGKLFEGSGDEMAKCIQSLMSVCDGDEILLCGHEYSETNLLYTLDVEPQNKDALKKFVWCHERRAKELPTVGFSTLNDEKLYNLFFRWDSPVVRKVCGYAEDDNVRPGQLIECLHKRKENFDSTEVFKRIAPQVKEYMQSMRRDTSTEVLQIETE